MSESINQWGNLLVDGSMLWIILGSSHQGLFGGCDEFNKRRLSCTGHSSAIQAHIYSVCIYEIYTCVLYSYKVFWGRLIKYWWSFPMPLSIEEVSNSSVKSSFFLPRMHWPATHQINNLSFFFFFIWIPWCIGLDFSITKQNRSISFHFQQSLKLALTIRNVNTHSL